MNFISDNAVGVAPEIMSALAEANRGPSMPYGADDWTKRVERKMAEIFVGKKVMRRDAATVIPRKKRVTEAASSGLMGA